MIDDRILTELGLTRQSPPNESWIRVDATGESTGSDTRAVLEQIRKLKHDKEFAENLLEIAVEEVKRLKQRLNK